MSIHPQAIAPVPEETDRVAKIAFPKGNCYLTLRDQIGTLYSDPEFTTLFSGWRQTAIAPWRLALICILQFIEDLRDRQAAAAIQSLNFTYKQTLSDRVSSERLAPLLEFPQPARR
jgi:transposase